MTDPPEKLIKTPDSSEFIDQCNRISDPLGASATGGKPT